MADMSGRSRKTYMLNMGPAHPSMHGVVRLVLELEGEKIIDVDTEIGYLHRAFEKHAENETWNNVVPWTDRLNYVSPLINNVGYAMAVEKLVGVTVPERGQYIRVIASEISRVTDHLTCVGATAMELGSLTVFLYLIKAREYLYQLVDNLTGARVTTSFTRVGGVKGDLPADFAGKFHADRQGDTHRRGRERQDARRATVFSWIAWRGRASFPRRTRSPTASPARSCARRASPTTCAALTRTRCTTSSISKSPSARPATTMTATCAGWPRSSRACASSSSVFQHIPPGKHSLEPKEIKYAFEIQDAGKRGDTALLARYAAKVDQTLAGMSKDDQSGTRVLDRAVTLPAKETAYANIEGLMNHFELVMWSWGVKIPALGDLFRRGRAATANSASTSSATAATAPIACAAARRACSPWRR